MEEVAKKTTKQAEELAETHEVEVAKPMNVQRTNDSSVETFISQAIQAQVPIETLERLLAMRKEVRADQAREAFTMAMAKFQKECPVIAKTKPVKNKSGDVTYKYAPLDSIILQVKQALGNNDLAYDFDERKSEDGTKLTAICTITHSMGHSKSASFEVEIGTEAYMTDTQKYGARMTFAKRYAFCNVLGIATGDEDTDARELTKKDSRKPADQKAQVIVLLRKLGITNTKDPEATKQKIVDLTQLEPVDANIPEIISRLNVLVTEKEDNENN